MPRLLAPIVALVAAMADDAPSGTTRATGATVLVELFTSEGCSSCPPADALLDELTREPSPGVRVVGLAEHVDYWDGPEWRDRFSSPIFTRRQEAYARHLGRPSVYTPQLVIGGRADALGSDPRTARAAIAAAARDPSGRVDARILPGSRKEPVVEVVARWADGVTADVLVAVVQDRATTHVGGGENSGRTLEHVAVARSLTVIGRGTGAFSRRVPLVRADGPAAWHVVVFVQEHDGGAVVAATTAAAP